MSSLLHHAIIDSAAREPDREAFRHGNASLTYAQLVERASRVAALLRSLGVARGDRVGLYLHKSIDLAPAVYGTLTAGAAYVPIDPAAPPDRIRFIVEDCGIRHLITGRSRARRARATAEAVPDLQYVLGADAPDDTGSTTTYLPWSAVDAMPVDAPDDATVDQDLAYVMYTSGSTGVPKGLMHTHASGRAYATTSARVYDLQPDDRLGNHSPLHFDMSTFEMFSGPLRGATTVLVPEETTLFPMELAALIERERLSVWYSVPLALIQLLDRGDLTRRDLTALRWVIFGGEPFPPRHLVRLQEVLPAARFSNSYGPAEVNQCTVFQVPPGPWPADQAVPLGRIWPEAEGLVLDTGDRPVVTGETGELVVHTPTMMRGYWARPDLDARAFLDREIAPGVDRRYYRTGDLVRERPDGDLEFLGRRDRQIKVRGYRVELEEIESVLVGLDGVAEAAAVDVRDAEGGGRHRGDGPPGGRGDARHGRPAAPGGRAPRALRCPGAPARPDRSPSHGQRQDRPPGAPRPVRVAGAPRPV